jgi:CRISPR/Cas system-associated protein Cas10 (large subunit of type III CRISPR-Cas system)
MKTLTLLEASEMRVKLKHLEKQITSGELSLLDRCEVEDEILELKEQLGDFERSVRDESGDCINCSG